MFTFSGNTTSPVYVPTTRAMLTATSPYGTSQTSQPPPTSVWPLQTDSSPYTTPGSHPSMASRLAAFPPTPNSPTGRAADPSSYVSNLAGRHAGITPYSPYVGSDVTSAWNSYNLGFGTPQGVTRIGGNFKTVCCSSYWINVMY